MPASPMLQHSVTPVSILFHSVLSVLPGGRYAACMSFPKASPPPLIAAGRVQAPATALMVVGGVNIAASLLAPAVAALFLLPLMAHAGPQDARAMSWVGLVPLVVGAVSWAASAVGGLMIATGVTMKRLQHYWLAVVVSILALFCSPSNLLGLIVGIWSLVVLSRKEVRAAFQAAAANPLPEVPLAASPRGKSSKAWVVVVILLLLGLMLVTLVPVLWYLKASSPNRRSGPVFLSPRNGVLTSPGPKLSGSAALTWRLTETARKLIKEQAGQYRYESIRIEMEPGNSKAKITFTNLRQGDSGAVVEGGFDALLNLDASWDFVGWGVLENVTGHLDPRTNP